MFRKLYEATQKAISETTVVLEPSDKIPSFACAEDRGIFVFNFKANKYENLLGFVAIEEQSVENLAEQVALSLVGHTHPESLAKIEQIIKNNC